MDGSATAFVTLGAVLFLGLLADEVTHRLRLPRVTILLLLGFAAGPGGFDVLPDAADDWFPIVSTLALTMVGFLLGAEFTADRLRAEGRQDLVIASTQAVLTAVVVSAGLWIADVDVATALALGGIAVATAPAATMAVISEQRADGPFTRTLMAVVALDDVIALTLFGIMATAAAYITTDDGGGRLAAESTWEIVGAVVVGLALGLPAAALTGRLQPGLPTQEEAYGVVLLCAGIALWLDASFLLAAVTMGVTIANRAGHHEVPFREIERIEWPALIVFFVLAGASLELSSLADVGWLGVGYVVLRSIGKMTGCALGARPVGLEATSRRWLGVAMLPQAGVAIGLSLLASERFPDQADDILAVVIGATVVFELVGPVLTRLALERTGESGTAGTDSDSAR